MTIRLLVAALCILLLPFWFSASPRGTAQYTPVSSSLAFAGHNAMGGSCGCGAPGCTCDAGEVPGNSRTTAEPEANLTKQGKHGVTGSRGKAESVDFGQLGLLFALALLFWRLRS